MAKQQKQQPVKTATKPKSTNETGAGGYILRNLAIIAVIGILFLVIDRIHAKERKFKAIAQEFQELQQAKMNEPRQRELYNEAMKLQGELAGDTGFLSKITRGYNWAIHELLPNNLDGIKKAKEEYARRGVDSTAQSLFEAKMMDRVGKNYGLIQYIRQNTPENAVLLLPEGDAKVSNDSKWNYVYDPEWMEYFIYPRLCVAIGRENEHPDLAKRVTHILIIEGKGYDKLKYDVPVEQRPDVAVLPINEPPAPQTTN